MYIAGLLPCRINQAFYHLFHYCIRSRIAISSQPRCLGTDLSRSGNAVVDGHPLIFWKNQVKPTTIKILLSASLRLIPRPSSSTNLIAIQSQDLRRVGLGKLLAMVNSHPPLPNSLQGPQRIPGNCKAFNAKRKQACAARKKIASVRILSKLTVL